MKLSEKILYRLTYALLRGMSLIPLRLLYAFSDFVSMLLHSVIRYRRRVVEDNLSSSFPEKSREEIRSIARGFYRFLTDYAFETVKLLDMSEADMCRRLRVENPEAVDAAVAQGRSVTLLLGHYCNWEWVSSLPLRFAPDTTCAQVYHHLHSRVMDRVFMKIRTRFGANNIEMADIMRSLIGWKKEGRPTVTGFIADQAPWLDVHLFVDFLNHDTGVYTGPERIARFLDSEVLFCHMSRPRRGEYALRFVNITSQPKKEETFSITRRYFEFLEANIREAPQYWLWSHRRWKRTRADFMEYWGDQAESRLSRL